MAKALTFGKLESALQEFSYVQRRKANHNVFEHPGGRLTIVLPRAQRDDAVTSTHRMIVEKTIRDDDVISWDDFAYYLTHGKRKEDSIRKGDRLIWTVPRTGQKIRVVAAAGEQDGLVIIKQKGVFSPCPVQQLRKDSSTVS